MRSLGSRRGGGRRDWPAAGDKPANVCGQDLEVTALIGQRPGPVADGTVARDHALRRQVTQLVDRRQKAAKVPVEYRHMGQENEITGEQRSSLLIKNGEVVVAMRRRPCPQKK